MNRLNNLQQLAVDAAKKSDWQKAIELNTEILTEDADNLGALNRLGLAYLQISKSNLAKKTFKAVLEFDPSNSIAKKNLEKIKNKQQTAPNFTHETFIEEPGKTKIVELHRLASKETLMGINSGQKCELKIKNRYISVECADKYLGTLPEDLSFRLTKLMGRKNKYECFAHSVSTKGCLVYIKEVFRSEKNKNIHSFPLNKQLIATINDIDEKFLLEDNIPMEIVNTDTDSEQNLDDVDISE